MVDPTVAVATKYYRPYVVVWSQYSRSYFDDLFSRYVLVTLNRKRFDYQEKVFFLEFYLTYHVTLKMIVSRIY